MLIALLIVLMIAIDQAVKYWALNILSTVDTMPLIEGVIHLTYVENRGAAFGMLADSRWVFMVVSAVSIVALSVYLIRKKPRSRLLCLSLAFVIGGGIGNMIDRVALGYVVDMIQTEFVEFPVFNIADCFLTCGCILLIAHLILCNKEFWKDGKK